MQRFSSILVGMCLVCMALPAADVELSGVVDLGFIHNFNDPRNVDAAGQAQDNKVYGLQNKEDSFNLATAQLNAAIVADPAGFNLKLNFFNQANIVDDDARDAGPSDDDDISIEEAYITWKTGDGSTMTVYAGKMASLIGYEENESAYNNHMTHGLLWHLAPLTNVGVRSAYTVAQNLKVILGVVNGADQERDDNRAKTIEAQITHSPSEAWTNSLQFNYGAEGTGESDKTFVLNFWSTYEMTEDCSCYIELTYSSVELTGAPDASFWGVGLGGITWVTDQHGISLRTEYVDDTDQVSAIGAVGGQYNWDVTLTGHYRITDDLMVRLELRHDESNLRSFNGREGASSDDTQNSLGIQMVYKF